MLDESALTTHTGANDGFITTAYDQSGHANAVNFVQATSTEQPVIVSSGTVQKQNSKPSAKQVRGENRVCLAANNWATRPSSAVVFTVFAKGTQAFVTPICTSALEAYTQYAATGSGSTVLGTTGTTFIVNGSYTATNGVTNRLTFHANIPASGLAITQANSIDFSLSPWSQVRTAKAFNLGSAGPDWISEQIFLASPSSEEISAILADIATFYGITLP